MISCEIVWEKRPGLWLVWYSQISNSLWFSCSIIWSHGRNYYFQFVLILIRIIEPWPNRPGWVTSIENKIWNRAVKTARSFINCVSRLTISSVVQNLSVISNTVNLRYNTISYHSPEDTCHLWGTCLLLRYSNWTSTKRELMTASRVTDSRS